MHGDRQQFLSPPLGFCQHTRARGLPRTHAPPARVSHVHGVGRSAHRGRADHRSDSEVEAARDRSRVAHIDAPPAWSPATLAVFALFFQRSASERADTSYSRHPPTGKAGVRAQSPVDRTSRPRRTFAMDHNQLPAGLFTPERPSGNGGVDNTVRHISPAPNLPASTTGRLFDAITTRSRPRARARAHLPPRDLIASGFYPAYFPIPSPS